KWVGRAQVRMVYTANVVPPSFTPGSPYPLPSYVLDASTGQWIDGFGQQASLPAVASADPLVPGGPVVPPLRNQPIDQAGAEAIARSLPDIGKDAIVRNSHLDDGVTGQHPMWSFDFALSDNSMIHVGVDALTGEVISLNRGGPVPLADGKTDSEEPAVTPEQARQIAIDFLKQVLPNRLGALVVPDHQPENPVIINGKMLPAGTIVKPPFLQNYVINVQHLHNGVIDDLSNVTISVDKKTGRVVSYYARFADDPGIAGGVTYPEGRPKSADEAKKAYLGAVQMTLAYTRLRGNPDDPQQLGPVRLVYLPVSASPLIGWDALSGDWIRPYAVPATGLNFEEISGHWAEKALRAMLQAGVLQPVGGKIAPDEPMTRGDFVAALARAVAPYGVPAPDKPSFRDVPPDHPDFPYIEWALQRGWIDPGQEFHPDAPLTRIAMADMIVRELGYQDLTQGKGIFQNPYSDMVGRSEREVGDTAIVTGLGIMRGSDGKFLPDEPASRAEAAVALYNLLAVRHP
ncbi:MAG: S-layer homology domain-containing protein, partial [Alicyclobacillaceae bacterium]|nr:S-layer homology domain-containing protein [Alicyclobacillaceae bacterium]